MATIELRLDLGEGELVEAAEDVERLLDDPALDVCPVCRRLLEALDDAITEAARTDGAASRRQRAR